jgi:hypothetical protein
MGDTAPTMSRIDSRSILPWLLNENQLSAAESNLDFSANMIVPWDLIKYLKIQGALDYVLS